MRRLLLCLFGLVGAVQQAQGQALQALSSIEAQPQLVVAPLEPTWDSRLVVPLVERLRPVGNYMPVRLGQGDVLSMVLSQPTSVGLMRRSDLDWGRVESGTAAFATIGPAACLILAVAPDAPWKSYTELNYAVGTNGLRIDVTSLNDLHTLDGLRRQLPLRVEPELSEQPLQLGIQRLLNGSTDVLAFEVVRNAQTPIPPPALAQARERGIRLLEIPAHLLQIDRKDLVVDDVPLSEPHFWRSGQTYSTLCDPFVMVFAATFADSLLERLYTAPVAPADVQSEDKPSLFAQVESAIRSLIVMMRQRFS